MSKSFAKYAGVFLLLCVPVCCVPGRTMGDASDTPGNPMQLDPTLQWQLADAAWSRREYADAAAMMITYANANPDATNAIDALWRAYFIYRSYRPNPDRRKAVFEQAVSLANAWITKYTQSDRDRAAKAMWFLANLYYQEEDHTKAIETLSNLTQQFPGTTAEASAYWSLGEWMREANQCAGAIDSYRAYQRIAGLCENWNVAAFRIGDCYEQLQDKERALAAYQSVVDEPGNNWSWWQLATGALDAARRARILGDEDLAKSLAKKVQQYSPTSGDWADIQRQAAEFLGGESSGAVEITARLTNSYSTNAVDVDDGTLLDAVRSASITIRPRADVDGRPFLGTVKFVPGAGTTADAQGGLSSDGTNGDLTAQFALSATNARVSHEAFYPFTLSRESSPAPGGLTVTRQWENKGPGWGIATIFIQSSQQWKFWVDLPNDRTNPANLTNQPDDVSNGGKTFGWIERGDLSGGMTIRLPIEPGDGVSEYYPAIRLERVSARLPDQSGSNTNASSSLPEYQFSVTSTSAFPYDLAFPIIDDVSIAEVKR